MHSDGVVSMIGDAMGNMTNTALQMSGTTNQTAFHGLTHGAHMPHSLMQGMFGDTPVPNPTSRHARGKPNASHIGDQILQATNASVTWHMPQDTSQWKPCDTARGQFTFGLFEPNGRQTDTRMPMYSLPITNLFLKHNPKWRKRFGQMRDASEVLRHLKPLGVQLAPQTDVRRNPGLILEENNFVRQGRARMPNIWLARTNSEVIQEGTSLYLILRRYPYRHVPDAVKQLWDRQAADIDDIREDGYAFPAAVLDEYPTVCDVHEQEDDQLIKSLVGDLLCDPVTQSTNVFIDARKDAETHTALFSSQAIGESIETGEFYWAFEPWSSAAGAAPPVALYTSLVDQGLAAQSYVGASVFVGIVSHVANGHNEPRKNAERARKAFVAVERNSDYLVSKVDEIEVMVGIGRREV